MRVVSVESSAVVPTYLHHAVLGQPFCADKLDGGKSGGLLSAVNEAVYFVYGSFGEDARHCFAVHRLG